MKNIFTLSTLLSIVSILLYSCAADETITVRKPINYTIILDLSDRILAPDQLDKDFRLIEIAFKSFEKRARKNLIITSKNRFSVKIIPQKGSHLNTSHYEDLLQIYLDEIDVSEKDKTMKNFSAFLQTTLKRLKDEALYSSKKSDYFGVDIWEYLHDNGMKLSKLNYDNTTIVLTDGYFDFEDQSHVIKNKNQYTSTRFLNEIKTFNWKSLAESKNIGLLPIKLQKETQWIIAGVNGKNINDILETEKITYFWKKWLKESGVTTSNIILNGSKTEMSSTLLEQLK